MNNIKRVKYNSIPDKVEKRLKNDEFCKMYHFHCLSREWKDAERRRTSDSRAKKKQKKKDTGAKKNITSSSPQKGELVLLLAKRIKKKDAHGRLRKSTTKNKTLF